MAEDGQQQHRVKRLSRLSRGDIEIGISDALQRHVARHVIPPKPVSDRQLRFEHARPRLLRECMAEATGVFFFVFPGIASTASMTLNFANSSGIPTPVFGSLLQIGLAFAAGISFAIITCAPVSGGHFNPAITICLAFWQGFPWKKVPHYIFSQIFGAFMAGLLLMGMYWPEIHAFAETNIQEQGTAVFNGGAASILCSFPNAKQTNQGYLFLQEFFVDSFIGIVIWACLDPANPFVAPGGVPFTIGLAYASMVWGFAQNTISTNLARDLGTRIVAAIFFGREAFAFDNGYAWIAVFVNIPATLFATAYYELLMRDSLAKIQIQGNAAHAEGETGVWRHLARVGAVPERRGTRFGLGRGRSRSGDGAHIEERDVAGTQVELGYMNATLDMGKVDD